MKSDLADDMLDSITTILEIMYDISSVLSSEEFDIWTSGSASFPTIVLGLSELPYKIDN